MTTFSLKEIPYVEVNINDEYILRFRQQVDGEYSCTLPKWMLHDLQAVVDKYNRKIKLIERN